MGDENGTGGFELTKAVRTVTLQGLTEPWANAEVVVITSVSLDKYMEIEDLQRNLAADELFKQFAKHVIHSWDLKIDDKPVPVTPAGIRKIPLELFRQITSGWDDAVAGKAVLSPLPDS